MDVPSEFYSFPEIDMLRLCNRFPAFAHNFVRNNHLFYDAVVDKTIKNVPPSLLLKRFPRCDKINHLVLLRGTIIKVNPILLKDVEQSYRCLYCDHSEIVKLANYKKKKKVICGKCGKNDFKIDEVFTKAKNCQIIRIQDIGNPQTMSDTIEILITGEQAGKFLPGENIEVLGIVRLKWPLLKMNEKLSPVIYLQSHSIRRTERKERLRFERLNDFMNVECFDKQRFLLKNFMNEIVGCENVKLGILLSVIGKKKKDKETRSNSHIMLVGTPGTGKSHFLRSVAHLAHSVSINGIGTSEAGLTTCAVKQGKEWLLEAGALILADNGICCIDAFDALPLYDKRGLLEVMEQQTLSVAKAGLVSTLNARCSVIAAYNISYYDTCKSICENLRISSPLISRFDLIFLIDEKYENDYVISQKVLTRSEVKHKKQHWNLGILKDFLETVRSNETDVSIEATNLINTYFKWRRTQKTEMFTIRNLESILRLSESHAKLLGKAVLDEDSVMTAIFLIESSLWRSQKIELDKKRIFIDEEYFGAKAQEMRAMMNN